MTTYILLDSSFLIYRAWHSLNAENFKDENGNYTNAVYGFVKSIKTITNIFKDEPSISIVACFDSCSKNHDRTKINNEYKSTRSVPNGLSHQFRYAYEACNALKIPYFYHKDYEADDIIATFSNKYGSKNKVIIISCDKDMYQLINDNVVLYNIIKKEFFKKQDVYDKYNVLPQNMVKYQAIVGDSCDNIKGIKGIGIKTAYYLVNYEENKKFEDEKEQRKFNKLVEKFNKEENQDIYKRNLKLVKLITDCDIDFKDIPKFTKENFKLESWKLFAKTLNINSI